MNNQKSEMQTAQAELEALEQDKPKFEQLLKQHQTNAATARQEAVAATKSGDLDLASELLVKASTLEAQAGSVRSMLRQHMGEIAAVQSRISALEAAQRRVSLIKQISETARAAHVETQAIEEELQATVETLTKFGERLLAHRATWKDHCADWDAFLPKFGLIPLNHISSIANPQEATAARNAHDKLNRELKALDVPTGPARNPPIRIDDSPFRMSEIDVSKMESIAKFGLKHMLEGLRQVEEYRRLQQLRTRR